MGIRLLGANFPVEYAMALAGAAQGLAAAAFQVSFIAPQQTELDSFVTTAARAQHFRYM
jgi:hypothetical protein